MSCHDEEQRHLVHLEILENIILIHDIDDIMLIRLISKKWLDHWRMCSRAQEIQPVKIQGPAISVKFFEVPCKVRDMLLHLSFPSFIGV
jgi:hypothetical protein